MKKGQINYKNRVTPEIGKTYQCSLHTAYNLTVKSVEPIINRKGQQADLVVKFEGTDFECSVGYLFEVE